MNGGMQKGAWILNHTEFSQAHNVNAIIHAGEVRRHKRIDTEALSFCLHRSARAVQHVLQRRHGQRHGSLYRRQFDIARITRYTRLE